jgi:hypothetical protein
MHDDNDDFETLSRNIETLLTEKDEPRAKRPSFLGGLFTK